MRSSAGGIRINHKKPVFRSTDLKHKKGTPGNAKRARSKKREIVRVYKEDLTEVGQKNLQGAIRRWSAEIDVQASDCVRICVRCQKTKIPHGKFCEDCRELPA